jgi:hypothetical protein
MSSPKAVAKARRARTTARPAAASSTATATRKAETRKVESSLSTEATQLAAALERALAAGQTDSLSDEALQALMAALCRTYGAQIEAGREVLPLKDRMSVTSTDIMTTASGLLRASNLAVFELGMWQSWTGR